MVSLSAPSDACGWPAPFVIYAGTHPGHGLARRITNRRFIYALLSRIPHRLSPVGRKLYDDLMTKFTPIESEFATSDDAAAYDAWFRAKVERSLASSAPRVPHDEVMAMARKVIEKHTHE